FHNYKVAKTWSLSLEVDVIAIFINFPGFKLVPDPVMMPERYGFQINFIFIYPGLINFKDNFCILDIFRISNASCPKPDIYIFVNLTFRKFRDKFGFAFKHFYSRGNFPKRFFCIKFDIMYTGSPFREFKL